MKVFKLLIVFVLFLCALLFYASFYVIKEGQAGILLHFSFGTKAPEKEEMILLKPGVHFILPYINYIKKFDLRLRDDEFRAQEISLSEQKYVLADYYVEWQIGDLNKYFNKIIKQGFTPQDFLRKEVNKNLETILNKLDLDGIVAEQANDLNFKLLKAVGDEANKFGIKLAKVGVIRIDYAPEINDLIFNKIRKHYLEINAEYREKADKNLKIFKNEADQAASDLLSLARIQASNIRAKGDSEAAVIYDQAYKQDFQFYLWQKSLELYKKKFSNGGNVLILEMDNALLKSLQQNNITVVRHKNG